MVEMRSEGRRLDHSGSERGQVKAKRGGRCAEQEPGDEVVVEGMKRRKMKSGNTHSCFRSSRESDHVVISPLLWALIEIDIGVRPTREGKAHLDPEEGEIRMKVELSRQMDL